MNDLSDTARLVLGILAEHPDGVRLYDIAREAGIRAERARRMLLILERAKMVERIGPPEWQSISYQRRSLRPLRRSHLWRLAPETTDVKSVDPEPVKGDPGTPPFGLSRRDT